MKIKVIESTHSWVHAGMIGEVTPRPDMDGFQVRFPNVTSQVPDNRHEMTIDIFMTQDQFEILESPKVEHVRLHILHPPFDLTEKLIKLQQENPDAYNTIAAFFAIK